MGLYLGEEVMVNGYCNTYNSRIEFMLLICVVAVLALLGLWAASTRRE